MLIDAVYLLLIILRFDINSSKLIYKLYLQFRRNFLALISDRTLYEISKWCLTHFSNMPSTIITEHILTMLKQRFPITCYLFFWRDADKMQMTPHKVRTNKTRRILWRKTAEEWFHMSQWKAINPKFDNKAKVHFNPITGFDRLVHPNDLAT